jgi:hypothetical protein
MLGVAWRGAMLAAFITELYAEAERGADAQIKLSEDPLWSIKRMANGPWGEQRGESAVLALLIAMLTTLLLPAPDVGICSADNIG